MTDHSDNPHEPPTTAGKIAPVRLQSGSGLRVVLASTALVLFVVSMFLPFIDAYDHLLGYETVYEISIALRDLLRDERGFLLEIVVLFLWLTSNPVLLILSTLMLTVLKDRKISVLLPVSLFVLIVNAVWLAIEVGEFLYGYYVWLAALIVLTVCTISAKVTWYRERRGVT